MKEHCVGFIHDPAPAVAWIEDNWGDPVLESIREGGFGGPCAQMLFLKEPTSALALFGDVTNKKLRKLAKSLRILAPFRVVILPSPESLLCVIWLTKIRC
jgi:hypothetical protein